MLPGPPVHLLHPSRSLSLPPSPFRTALFSRLAARCQAPPGLPRSSAFADSSIKDITKSTLDENTLPLYRGEHRERGERKRYVCKRVATGPCANRCTMEPPQPPSPTPFGPPQHHEKTPRASPRLSTTTPTLGRARDSWAPEFSPIDLSQTPLNIGSSADSAIEGNHSSSTVLVCANGRVACSLLFGKIFSNASFRGISFESRNH